MSCDACIVLSLSYQGNLIGYTPEIQHSPWKMMVGIFGIRVSFLEDRFSGAMLNFTVVFWKLSQNKTPSSALVQNLPHFGWVIQPSRGLVYIQPAMYWPDWNPQHEKVSNWWCGFNHICCLYGLFDVYLGKMNPPQLLMIFLQSTWWHYEPILDLFFST